MTGDEGSFPSSLPKSKKGAAQQQPDIPPLFFPISHSPFFPVF
jgi:hypothetical protein